MPSAARLLTARQAGGLTTSPISDMVILLGTTGIPADRKRTIGGTTVDGLSADGLTTSGIPADRRPSRSQLTGDDPRQASPFELVITIVITRSVMTVVITMTNIGARRGAMRGEGEERQLHVVCNGALVGHTSSSATGSRSWVPTRRHHRRPATKRTNCSECLQSAIARGLEQFVRFEPGAQSSPDVGGVERDPDRDQGVGTATSSMANMSPCLSRVSRITAFGTKATPQI